MLTGREITEAIKKVEAINEYINERSEGRKKLKASGALTQALVAYDRQTAETLVQRLKLPPNPA